MTDVLIKPTANLLTVTDFRIYKIEEGSTVTFDLGAVPYIQARVDVDPAIDLATINPYEADFILLAFGETNMLAVVTGRRLNRKTGRVTITAASGEAILADYRALADNKLLGAPRGSLRAMVSAVLAIALGVVPEDLLAPGPDTAAATGDPDDVDKALTWWAGTSAWDFLQPLVTAAGMVLWCDEIWAWHLDVPESRTTPGQVFVHADNAVEADDERDRHADEWCTGVVVVYEWTDPAGVRMRRVDTAGTASKVHVVNFDTAYPGPGAAAAILARRTDRGSSLSAVTVSDATARPGMLLRAGFDGEQLGRIERVQFDLYDGLMTVSSRGLLDVLPGSWLAWDAGQWTDISPAEKWTD